MSRPRQRPTREETKARLLEGAAEVFAAKGIQGASIEDICTAAGFSRGAFYSNFSTKDDLVLDLLDAHLEANQREIERLYDVSEDPTQFLASMESVERRAVGPMGPDGGLLYMELVLYATRNPDNRPRLVELRNQARERNRVVIERIVEAVGSPYPMAVDDVITFIMALDDGLSLHRLLEPERIRDTHFSELVLAIHQLWIDSLGSG